MKQIDARHVWEIFENGQNLLPEAPRVGWGTMFHATGAGMGNRHLHQEEFEICLVASGTLRMRVQEQTLTAQRRQVLIVPPRHIHCGAGPRQITGPAQVCWAEVDMNRLAGALKGTGAEVMLRRLIACPPRVVDASDETVRCLRRLVDEHRLRDAASATAARLAAQSLLIALARDVSGPPATRRPLLSEPIRRLVQWLDAHPSRRISTLAMAGRAGLSAPHLCRRFREEVGQSPREYLRDRCMELSARLLADGKMSVAEIAREAGFRSGQYFATAFRRYADASPMAYRKETQER